MPTRRIPTNPDTPDWSLSEPQRTAVDLIVSGKTLQDTADAIAVTRQTVSVWLNHHPGFQAALNKRRQELWADLVDGLRALAPKALAVLARALDGEEPLPAAVHVLKACWLYGGVQAPSGPTDPEPIALAMKLAEDDRQHAAENAEIAIKRRGFDRMLAQLAADPTAGGWTPGP
jgi:hypothetical protein